MNKLILLFFVVVGSAYAADIQFLSADKLGAAKFDAAKFDAAKFKDGDMTVRASMTADLIKSKTFVGKPVADVEKELGHPDGHYQTKESAYVVGSEGKDLWQLVFLPDVSGKTVGDVKVHKRFCFVSQPPPPEPPYIVSKVVGKKWGVTITGEVAKAMFAQMGTLEIEKGAREGESVTCTKMNKTDVKCTLVMDVDGVIEAK